MNLRKNAAAGLTASGTCVRGRYFILTRQELDAATEGMGGGQEVVPLDKLLARAHEIAEGLAKLPPLTSRYSRIALTQKLRRVIDHVVGCGLALQGISAADVARIVVLHGGIVPAPRRRALAALRLEEREEISRGIAVGRSIRQIGPRPSAIDSKPGDQAQRRQSGLSCKPG